MNMNYQNYSLDKNIKKLQYIFYILIQENDNTEINKFIDYYTINCLLDSKNSGIISNLLNYYLIYDKKIGLYIINYMDKLDGFEFMKRDYLKIIKHYHYNDNLEYANLIFKNKILSANNCILSQDIDYIIDNNMTELLINLDGTFVETPNNMYPVINSLQLKLKLYEMPPNIIERMLFNIKKQLNRYSDIQLPSIKAIIDGGNVIHNIRGQITDNSLSNLIKISNIVKQNIGNPLLIIHERHTKTIPRLIQTLYDNNITYFLTPYKFNDDLFILWHFLSQLTKVFIITNDKFRDHIDKLLYNNNVTSDFEYNLLKNIIKQQTINYSIKNNTINKLPIFSNCIQVLDHNIYVPHVKGNGILIPITNF